LDVFSTVSVAFHCVIYTSFPVPMVSGQGVYAAALYLIVFRGNKDFRTRHSGAARLL
jgi:hypothetical protein